MPILDTETLKAVGLVVGSLITGAVAKAKLPLRRNGGPPIQDSKLRTQVTVNTEKISTLEKGQDKLFKKVDTVAEGVSYISGKIDEALKTKN